MTNPMHCVFYQKMADEIKDVVFLKVDVDDAPVSLSLCATGCTSGETLTFL